MREYFNPIQAEVFCYYIVWGIVLPPPPPVSPLRVVQLSPNWHDSSLRQNLSKAVKFRNDVTMTSMTSSMLC